MTVPRAPLTGNKLCRFFQARGCFKERSGQVKLAVSFAFARPQRVVFYRAGWALPGFSALLFCVSRIDFG